jgi:thiamine biosynthesis lipoprotein
MDPCRRPEVIDDDPTQPAQHPRSPRADARARASTDPYGRDRGHRRHGVDRRPRRQRAPRSKLHRCGHGNKPDPFTRHDDHDDDAGKHDDFFGPQWDVDHDHDASHDDHDASHDDHDASHDDHDTSRGHVGRNLAVTNMMSADALLAERSFRAIGTIATVVVSGHASADAAQLILRDEIAAIDRACSRFRPDSELEWLHGHSGRPLAVSALLFEALDVAVAVAERTHGAVDPTVGNAMAILGYDRDFEEVRSRPLLPPPPGALGPVAGFGHVHLCARTRTVRIPRGVRLDLGASAKALAADRAAARIATQLDTGVLVSIGGDIAVAGPAPDGGWPIGIADDSSITGAEVDQVVAIRDGGLASSSTVVRSWTVGARRVHHIVDPTTGDCAAPYWKLVSASGRTCVDANAVSTAAIVWGADALERLPAFDQAVRLVRHDDTIFTLGEWPADGVA